MTEKKKGAEKHKQEFSLISNETLLALYRGLSKARAARSQNSRTSGWPFEAAAVAVHQDLSADDAVITADALNRTALNGHKPQIARELQRAIGSALTQKTKNNGKVTVVFGGVKQGGEAWADALETARAHRLPMVFVAAAQQDQAPARDARKSKGTELEPGTEMARIIVDGHDVVGSYRVAHEAIQRARKARGATLIECAEFRLPGKRRQDAIAAMENYLRSKGLFEPGAKQRMKAR
jgi:pyruvate dehydrogenase E1 component alpha subunit